MCVFQRLSSMRFDQLKLVDNYLFLTIHIQTLVALNWVTKTIRPGYLLPSRYPSPLPMVYLYGGRTQLQTLVAIYGVT